MATMYDSRMNLPLEPGAYELLSTKEALPIRGLGAATRSKDDILHRTVMGRYYLPCVNASTLAACASLANDSDHDVAVPQRVLRQRW